MSFLLTPFITSPVDFLKILMLLLLPLSVSGQELKSGYITYEFLTPYKPEGKTKAILYFNATASLFIYDKIGMTDSVEELAKMMSSAQGAYIQVSGKDAAGARVFRNFETRTMIFRQSETKPLDAFIVEDVWTEIAWKVQDKFKKIDSFNCRKATGTFRGRTYTAWFTKDIPLPYGPWKLFGLPGIILEATEQQKQFSFKMTKVCYPCDTSGIINPPEEPIKKSLKEYVDYMDHYMLEVEKKFREKLPSGISVKLNNPPTKASIKQERKRRLEKSYEWEAKQPEMEVKLKEE